MTKTWILFSKKHDAYSEEASFQTLFWKEPHTEDLAKFFLGKNTHLSPLLKGDMEDILKGKKTPLYGEIYWVREFDNPSILTKWKQEISSWLQQFSS